MALFGAPLAHEDHAVRACYAALRMQESLKRYAKECADPGHSDSDPRWFELRRSRGRCYRERLEMDYTAIGQTAHLAARMEQLAMPGSILLTADTLHLAEGYVQVKSLGPVTVKG